MPKHIFHLVKAINGRAQVTLFSAPDEGGYADAQALGAQHYSIHGLASGLSPLRAVRACRALIRHLEAQAADLIWVHARLAVLMCRIAILLGAWRPVKPVLFTYHGLPFGKGHRPVLGWVSGVVERCILRTASELDLVFLSDEMKNRMIAHVGEKTAARHRLHVLPNCSDLGQLVPTRRKAGCNIVMTGRVSFQKDYDTAVRVFSSLSDHFTFTLVGSGTQTDSFQQRIASIVPANTFERITFCGPVSDVRPLVSAADVFMMTSRYEGLPIGALEAFEAGLPLILRDFDGARELAAMHPFAMVTAFRDFASDQDQILKLLADYRRQTPYSDKAIKHAWSLSFSPEIFQRRVEQLLLDCGVPLIRSEAAQGCVHDAQGRHQCRGKKSVVPPPVPQPCCTNGAPSALSE